MIVPGWQMDEVQELNVGGHVTYNNTWIVIRFQCYKGKLDNYIAQVKALGGKFYKDQDNAWVLSADVFEEVMEAFPEFHYCKETSKTRA